MFDVSARSRGPRAVLQFLSNGPRAATFWAAPCAVFACALGLAGPAGAAVVNGVAGLVAGVPVLPSSPAGKIPGPLYVLVQTTNAPFVNVPGVGRRRGVLVPVTNIVATAGLTVAQMETASKNKAIAVSAAINAAAAADAKKNPKGPLSGVVAAVPNQTVASPVFIPGPFGIPQRVMVNLTPLTVSGVTGAAGPIGNTTGENGDGGNFVPNGGGGGGNGGSYQPSMGGTGSGTGMSTGSDGAGHPSVIGFGFIDVTTPTPTNYIAALEPASGLTDSAALLQLSALFNKDYGAAGFTTSYNAGTDILSLNQTLPAGDYVWDANTDTGLNFTAALTAVPEPTTLALLAAGCAVLLLRRKAPRSAAK